jgi:lysyl-tRNA synthetase class 1
MAMHWSSEYAGKLLERGKKHIIETGTSISGIPHVGNASDVIRGDAVRKAAVELGLKAELIWVADDGDPFRKVPAGMESLREYLGFPVKDIPDPQGCHKSFVEHFVEPFIENLARFGVKPIQYSGTELYRSGALKKEIKTAFRKKEDIVNILNEFRDTPLPEDYVPWTPVCGGCGRMSTTRVTGLEKFKVDYVCESTEIAGGEAAGCGHEGVSHVLKGEGKLPWRVEWAARWHHFKVTCEPFGKEHATVGGSYDTSKLISKQVFGWEPPVPVVYEFFTLNREKISSSKGNVITLGDWLEIAEPEVLKYFMYKRLQKQRDINLRTLPSLVDEYDTAERIYFGRIRGDEVLKGMYELAQVKELEYLNIPYTLCAVLAQIIPDLDEEAVSKRVSVMGYGDYSIRRLLDRVHLAGEWVKRHGPEYLRFQLISSDKAAEAVKKLDEKQKKALKQLAIELKKEWTPQELHKRIYETARGIDLHPNKLFEAVYLVLIGKKLGPKAAMFLLTLERDFVIERLNLS